MRVSVWKAWHANINPKSQIPSPKSQVPATSHRDTETQRKISISASPSLVARRWDLEFWGLGLGAWDLPRQREAGFFSQNVCARAGPRRVAPCKIVIATTKTTPQYLDRSGKLLPLRRSGHAIR